jgi:HEAT repeat protein
MRIKSIFIGLILTFLKIFKAVAKDDVPSVRAAAATKVQGDPDTRNGEALAKSADDPKWIVRAAVVDAIARGDNPSLLTAVVTFLDNEIDAVRLCSAAAVARLSPSRKCLAGSQV